MAVGEGLRSRGGKLDDGSSVIDKRYYGRSRKTRVRPADVADEPPPPLPPSSSTADNMAPQQPIHSTTDPASASARPESESPPSSLPCPPPSSPSSDSTSTSATHRSSSTKSCNTTTSQPPRAPPPTTPREKRLQSSSDKQRRRRSRHRRGDGGGRRGDDDSTRTTPATHRASREGDRRKKTSHSRHRERLPTSRSRRRSWGFSSAADASSRPGKEETEASTTQSGGSYSSSGGTSGRTFPGGTATSPEEGEDHGRRTLRDDRPDDRFSCNNRQSKSREGSSEHDRRRSHRGGKTRGNKPRRTREGRRSEGRRSQDGRRYDRKRSSDARKGDSNSRHPSDSQIRRRHHHHYRRGPRSSSSSSSSSSSQQHRSRGKREGSAARTDRTRRGSSLQKRKRKNDRRTPAHGGHRGHPRADDNTATGRRLVRASTEGEAGGEEQVALESEKTAAGTKFPAKPKKTAGIAREDSEAGVLKRRRHLRQTTLEAVLTVQCLFRGYVARNRVTGRREALAFLRGACLGVAIDIIDAFIREDAAPRIIYGVLAKGFERGGGGAAQRAEAVAAANALLEETSASLVRELVVLGLTEEANSHLDAVFVRDRRNPLLATVDDIIAETLRKWMREAVVEVVKEGAEDFMFGRRISELVQVVIEEGMVEAVRPIAAEVYHSAIALAAFSEVEQELCAEEAKLVVAETMAPFEGQLVELQREKDVAAIQAAAHHVMIKGLQLQHAARTVGQRGRLVLMSDINGKTLNLLLAGRFLAILRAAETNRQKVSTSPLLFMLFQRLVVRTGRSVLLEELARELDRDESALHALELERIEELDRHRRRVDRDRPAA